MVCQVWPRPARLSTSIDAGLNVWIRGGESSGKRGRIPQVCRIWDVWIGWRQVQFVKSCPNSQTWRWRSPTAQGTWPTLGVTREASSELLTLPGPNFLLKKCGVHRVRVPGVPAHLLIITCSMTFESFYCWTGISKCIKQFLCNRASCKNEVVDSLSLIPKQLSNRDSQDLISWVQFYS